MNRVKLLPEKPSGESKRPTPWAVICRGVRDEGFNGCGQVFMVKEYYLEQLRFADETWRCPRCGRRDVEFDEDNFEKRLPSTSPTKRDADVFEDTSLGGPALDTDVEDDIPF